MTTRSSASSRNANAVGCSPSTGASVAHPAFRPGCGGGVAGERGEAEQAVGRERVLRRRRVVLVVLRPHDQRLGVGAGREEPAAVVVGEQRDEAVGDGAGLVEPGDVVDLGQREQRLEQRGVVLGVGEQVGAAVLPGAQQPAVVAAQLGEEEVGVGARRVHPVGPVERVGRLGERPQEERVPPEEHLVVEAGPHPVPARRRRATGSDARDRVRPVLGRADRVEDVAAEPGVRVLEVAPGGHAEVAHDARAGRRRRAPRAPRATTRRTCPRRPRSRRPRRRRTRRPRGAGRGARRRRSPRRRGGSAARR